MELINDRNWSHDQALHEMTHMRSEHYLPSATSSGGQTKSWTKTRQCAVLLFQPFSAHPQGSKQHAHDRNHRRLISMLGWFCGIEQQLENIIPDSRDRRLLRGPLGLCHDRRKLWCRHSAARWWCVHTRTWGGWWRCIHMRTLRARRWCGRMHRFYLVQAVTC